MKLLGILRHAKSSWDDKAARDFDRPLNDRGRAAAVRMGEAFRKLGLDYELALVSPARRAADTFALISDRWGHASEVRSEPRIYEASLQELLAIVGGTPARVQRLLLVGHNPGLHQLAIYLSGGDTPQRLLLGENLPTGSLVEIGLPADRWQGAEAGGELLRFLRPRDLGPD